MSPGSGAVPIIRKLEYKGGGNNTISYTIKYAEKTDDGKLRAKQVPSVEAKLLTTPSPL